MLFVEASTRQQIARDYPDAVKIVKVCGGYAVFFSSSDYQNWRRQN